MKINNLDLLHHKIIVGRSRGGDVSEHETQLHNNLREGIKNKCPITQDFINRINANKPFVLKSSFIKKHAKTIIKFSEKPYELMKWFLIASCLIASIVEVYYA